MQLVMTILYVAFAAGIVAIVVGFRAPMRRLMSIPRGAGLMVFTWLFLYIGMGLWFGRLDQPTTLSEVDKSAVLQIVSVGFAFFVAIAGIAKRRALGNLQGPLLFLFLYALLGVLTAPLSPVPALSVFKAGSLAVVSLFAAVAVDALADGHARRILVNSAYLYLGGLVFLAVVGGIFFPEITHRPNKGIFGMMLVGWPALNSNSLSFISAIIAVVGLRRFVEPQPFASRVFYLGVLVAAFCVLLLAQGRTSIIGFFIAAMLLSTVIPGLRWVRVALVVGLVGVVATYMLTGEIGDWAGTLETYLRRGSDDESLKTLSGRTEVWRAGWQLFLQKPLFGYGYYAAEKLGIAAHSAYVLVLINSGIMGFGLWATYMYWGMLGAARDLFSIKWRCHSKEQRFQAEICGVLVILFLRTITGSDLTTHHYSTMVFVAWLVYRAIRRKAPLTQQAENGSGETVSQPTAVGTRRILAPRHKKGIPKLGR